MFWVHSWHYQEIWYYSNLKHNLRHYVTLLLNHHGLRKQLECKAPICHEALVIHQKFHGIQNSWVNFLISWTLRCMAQAISLAVLTAHVTTSCALLAGVTHVQFNDYSLHFKMVGSLFFYLNYHNDCYLNACLAFCFIKPCISKKKS